VRRIRVCALMKGVTFCAYFPSGDEVEGFVGSVDV